MKRVFSAETLPAVAHVKNLLESQGIACTLKNEHMGSVMGEVPFIAVWPEVWVRDGEDAARAEAIIARELNAPDCQGPPWNCPDCGAENEAQFAACWSCEAARLEDR